MDETSSSDVALSSIARRCTRPLYNWAQGTDILKRAADLGVSVSKRSEEDVDDGDVVMF